jgi:hypothetical protein
MAQSSQTADHLSGVSGCDTSDFADFPFVAMLKTRHNILFFIGFPLYSVLGMPSCYSPASKPSIIPCLPWGPRS